MSYLRPPSPHEASPVRVPKLEIGRVIGRSFAVVRRRWRPLGAFLLAYLALEWTYTLAHVGHYQSGARDLPAFSLVVASSVAFTCLQWLRNTAFTASALQQESSPPSIRNAFRSTCGAVPTLLPFAVLSDLPVLAFSFWGDWSGPSGGTPEQMLYLSMLTSLGMLAWYLFLTFGWGVVIPVAIVERGDFVVALTRAWRLLEGNRGRFLALYIVQMVVGFLPTLIGAALTFPIAHAIGKDGRLSEYHQVERVVSGLLALSVTGTWYVMVGIVFQELRRLRDGVFAGHVVEVFA